MVSKFEVLRSGEPVEIEPGRVGKLDLENKNFITSDGRSIYVGEDEDFFPKTEERRKYSQEKEKIQGEINRAPLGEFLFQFGNQGIAGSAKDWMNRLTDKSEDYLRKKRVNQDVGEDISSRSPFTSGAATIASFIPDIALTKGMSAAKAAPLLTAAHSGSRIVDDPSQVAGEAAISGVGGLLLDKATGFLGKVASRRGEIRNLPKIQEETALANRAGSESVISENLANKEKFNFLTQEAKKENASKLAQYEAQLITRQNEMISAKNAYEQAKNAGNLTKQQNAQLKNEFDKAKKSYDIAVKDVPRLQSEAQKEFSENIVNRASKLERSFPKNSVIHTEQLSPLTFISEKIEQAGLAADPNATKAKKIINGIFSDGESFSAKKLKDKYIALETAIQKSTPETKKILSDFKTYMGEKLPTIVADNWSYSQVVPNLKNQILKASEKSLDGLQLSRYGLGSKDYINRNLNKNINQIFKETTPNQFYRELQDGTLRSKIKDRLLTIDDFSSSFPDTLKKTKKGVSTSLEKLENLGLKPVNPEYVAYENFSNRVDKALDEIFYRAKAKTQIAEYEALHRLGGKVDKTLGLAPEIPKPTTPQPPQMATIPPVPQLPSVSPFPQKPSLNPLPTPPTPMQFSPADMPTLSPAKSFSDSSGDFLEKNLLSSGKSALNNPFTKLAGLKYVLGKGALPLEAAYIGMKGLTSPTVGGNVARMTFEKGGVEAIDSLARKYSSYKNGVLADPQERRSLTKEIEDDSSIPIGKKAVIQSKINRGKPINENLIL